MVISKGNFTKINEALNVLVGEITEIEDPSEGQPGYQKRYTVSLKYGEYNGETKSNDEKITKISFWNQTPRNDGGAEAKPYADYVRKMKLKPGYVIFAVVKFNDDNHENATGYSARYNGIMPLDGESKYNIVCGLVSWAKDTTFSNGSTGSKIGVYLGKNQDGENISVTINVGENLAPRARKALFPKENGTKVNAIFKCGSPFHASSMDSFGNYSEFDIYTAFDFTVTGYRNKK